MLLQVQFINCDFMECTAAQGGSVALVSGAEGHFQQCTFSDNTATNGIGGAVLLTGQVRVWSQARAATSLTSCKASCCSGTSCRTILRGPQRTRPKRMSFIEQ